MALPAAIFMGVVAAVGIPYAFENAPDPWHGWALAGSVAFPLGQIELHWSWPVFCVVTLIVWGTLNAARQG